MGNGEEGSSGTDGWGRFLFSPMGGRQRAVRVGFLFISGVGQTLLAILTLSLWFSSEPAVHKIHFAVTAWFSLFSLSFVLFLNDIFSFFFNSCY